MTYTADITVDSLSRALTEAGNNFASMLRRVHDADSPAIGSWTVGETAAHVARSAEYFLEAARAETTPVALDDVADHNAEFLADNLERDPGALADRFEDNELALLTYVRLLNGDPVVEVFDGVIVPMSTLLAVELARCWFTDTTSPALRASTGQSPRTTPHSQSAVSSPSSPT